MVDKNDRTRTSKTETTMATGVAPRGALGGNPAGETVNADRAGRTSELAAGPDTEDKVSLEFDKKHTHRGTEYAKGATLVVPRVEADAILATGKAHEVG